jgi:hypothetical protein
MSPQLGDGTMAAAVVDGIRVNLGGLSACRGRIQALRDSTEVKDAFDMLAGHQFANSQGDYAAEVDTLDTGFAAVAQNLDALFSSTIQVLDSTSGLFAEGDTLCGSLFNGS